MTTSGLSTAGLAHLHDVMSGHVAAGEMPGLVTLVARGDDVHVDTIGSPSFADRTPLDRSAIFRIASLTKPITAVDDDVTGRGRAAAPRPDRSTTCCPSSPIAGCCARIDAELDDTVAADRPITRRGPAHLPARVRIGDGAARQLSRSSGRRPRSACRASAVRRGRPVDARRRQLDGGPRLAAAHVPTGRAVALRHVGPGARRAGGSRATGNDLETVMRERIFEPLGMRDTGFTVPAGQLHRLTTFYAPDAETGELSVLDDPTDSWWSTPPSFPDAAGGLVSTVDDYWSFVSMVLADGTLRGRARPVPRVGRAHDHGPALEGPA